MRTVLLCLLMLFVTPILSAQEIFSPNNGINTKGQNAVAALASVKRRAENSYSKQNYRQAFSTYKTLSQLGDKFSQYRLAFMYKNGLGVEQDTQQALAWAYVAAEKQTEPALGFYRSIKANMSEAEFKQVEPLGVMYLEEYGISASSKRIYAHLRREVISCGPSCDRKFASSRNCNGSGEGIPSKSCLMMGMTGLPGVQRTQPLAIRKAQDNLRVLIANYNPGRVEFGEFQVIEEGLDTRQSTKPNLQLKQRAYTIDGFVDIEAEEQGDTLKDGN